MPRSRFQPQLRPGVRQTDDLPLLGRSFHEAAAVLDDPLSTTFPDQAHSEDEARFVTLGVSRQGTVLVVAHTERNDAIRIISARRATRREREFYEQG